MTRRVTILGSTGSIGKNTLDVIRHSQPGEFQVVALTAHKNFDTLAEQAIEFGAQYVAISDDSHVAPLKERLSGHSVEVKGGRSSLSEAAAIPADFTMAAIIGAAGLEPTLKAVDQGNHVGLANKECLVCAGDLFMERVRASGAKLLPVDSEHNAIFQVLEHDRPEGVRRLILTASGGPFRTLPADRMDKITPKDALDHPVWSMGAKISIDSATLMNKGLELIEASYLFNRPSADIGVVVHPQSIIHSMVEYIDGSVLCQMGCPDMRTPIAYALGWPDRLAAPVERLDLAKISKLTFFDPDNETFPALNLARSALEAGGQAPNVLNAANEVAVAAFLAENIGYTDIVAVVAEVLERKAAKSTFARASKSVAEIIAADEGARATARDIIKAL